MLKCSGYATYSFFKNSGKGDFNVCLSPTVASLFHTGNGKIWSVMNIGHEYIKLNCQIFAGE